MFVNGIHVEEYAKLEYGRLLWRVPAYRERLLRHWRDPRHPHAERFAEHEVRVTLLWPAPKIPTTRWIQNCASAIQASALSSKKFLGVRLVFLN